MFCTRCGTNNNDGTKFCVVCGTPLNQGAVSVDNQYNNPTAAPFVAQGGATVPPMAQPANNYAGLNEQATQYYSQPVMTPQPIQPEPPQKEKTGLIVGIIVGALVLIGAVVAVLFATGVIELDLKSTATKIEQTAKKEKKDPATVAKENLEGAWLLTFEGDRLYDYGVTSLELPFVLVLEADGTYYVTEDQAKFDDMVYNTMMDAFLGGDGYFEIIDDKIRVRTSPSTLPDDSNRLYYNGEKVKLNTGHKVSVLEIVNSPNDIENPKWCHIEFIYDGVRLEGYVSADYVRAVDYSSGEVTMESFKERMLGDCPFEDYGYWATNGEYIFFAYSEEEAKDFEKNPENYANDDRVIYVDATKEIDTFSEYFSDGTIYFDKQR